MPSSPCSSPMVSRRRALAAGATLAALAVVASACGPTPPPEPDALAGQLELAHHDAALASAAAAGMTGPIAAALEQIAAQRQAHAQALETEINRVSGTTAETTTSTAAPGRVSVDDVVAALQDSAQSATQFATTQSGYRAGLLGSIAAACTVDHTVTLATQGRPR